jgi:hypothetical protein
MLIEAARVASVRAAKAEGGWLYDALIAITFSALAIEALCNSFGVRVFEDWEDLESASPNAKLRLLADKLSIEYVKNDEPWSTARWLAKFRNRVAHAKPEFVREELLLTQAELDKRMFDKPESKLERDITVANATRAVGGAENLKRLLFSRIPPEEAFTLFADGWSGHTELKPDA